ERKPPVHFPVILREICLVEVDVGAPDVGVDVGIGHCAEQETGYPRARPGQALWISGKPRVEIKDTGALEAGIDAVHMAAKFRSHLDRVPAPDEGHVVRQLLGVHGKYPADSPEAGRKAL